MKLKTYNPFYFGGGLSGFSQTFRLLTNSGNFPCQMKRFFSIRSNLLSHCLIKNLRDVTMMVKKDNKAEMEFCANGTVISALTVGMENVEYL